MDDELFVGLLEAIRCLIDLLCDVVVIDDVDDVVYVDIGAVEHGRASCLVESSAS